LQYLICIHFITSVADVDFITTSAVLTFNASTPLQCDQVIIVNDGILENNETFFVQLKSTDDVVNVSLNSAPVTIIDDDCEFGLFNMCADWVCLRLCFPSTVINVGLQDTEHSINEQSGIVTVCAVLDGETERDLQVTLSTQSNTAVG